MTETKGSIAQFKVGTGEVSIDIKKKDPSRGIVRFYVTYIEV